ncbi:MAG: substrate-binding domain-containing protein [Christensenellales bacterium]
MNTKKILALVLSLLLVVALFGACSDEQSTPSEEPSAAAPTEKPSEAPPADDDEPSEAPNAGGKKTIAFCIANADDQWLSYMYDAAREFADQNPDYDYVWGDGKNDLAEQLSIVENWVMQGVDAMVINPYDSESTGPIVDMCNENDIVVVAVNRTFPNQDQATSVCTGDNKQAGLLEARYIAEQLEEGDPVAVFRGQDNHESSQERVAGFEEICEEFGLEIIFNQTGNYFRDEGLKLAEDLIQSGQEFKAIFSANDEMAIGAYMACDAAGLEGIMIGGIDATPDALQYLNEGSMYVCTVFQDAKGQAWGGLQAAVDALEGKDVEAEIYIDFELVVAADRDKYLEIWGL